MQREIHGFSLLTQEPFYINIEGLAFGALKPGKEGAKAHPEISSEKVLKSWFWLGAAGSLFALFRVIDR